MINLPTAIPTIVFSVFCVSESFRDFTKRWHNICAHFYLRRRQRCLYHHYSSSLLFSFCLSAIVALPKWAQTHKHTNGTRDSHAHAHARWSTELSSHTLLAAIALSTGCPYCVWIVRRRHRSQPSHRMHRQQNWKRKWETCRLTGFA